MSEEYKIKKEQAGGESGGEKEQAKSKIDKMEKILGGKDCMCLSQILRQLVLGLMQILHITEQYCI